MLLGVFTASGVITCPGTVSGVLPASGPTVLAAGALVALGVMVWDFFVVALGRAPPRSIPMVFGLILALGAMGPLGATLAAGPAPPTARPRCATLTPLSKPSNIPQMSNFFILVSPISSVWRGGKLHMDLNSNEQLRL